MTKKFVGKIVYRLAKRKAAFDIWLATRRCSIVHNPIKLTSSR